MSTLKSTVTLLLALLISPIPGTVAAEGADAFRSEDNAYSIFVLLKSDRSWLDLSVPQRFEFLGAEVQPILADHPQVSMKFWDTEHFNAQVTDVVLFETQDLAAYQSVIEKLRESRFWDHYFEVLHILPGIENAYATYYDREALGSND